jgi:hypothetical protein
MHRAAETFRRRQRCVSFPTRQLAYRPPVTTALASAPGRSVATLTHVDRARNAEVRLPFVNGERADGHCRSAMLPDPKEVPG